MTTDGPPEGGSGFRPKFFTEATEEPSEAGSPRTEALPAYDDGYLSEDDAAQPDFLRFDSAEALSSSSLEDFTYSALRFRHKEVARRYALGHSRQHIAKALGYTPESVTNVLKRSEVKQEVLRYRQLLFDRDLTEALKDLGPEALGNVETMLRDKVNVKPKERFEASKWVIEKLSGKPKQEVEVNDTTFANVMDLLTQMRERGEPLRPYSEFLAPPEEPIDVIPAAPAAAKGDEGERTENDSQLPAEPAGASPLTLGKNLFD